MAQKISATLASTGTLGIEPLRFSGTCTLTGIPITAFDAYYPENLHLIIADASDRVLGQELPALVDDGYTSFKVFMTYEGLALSDMEMLNVMSVARETGALVMVHAENYDAIRFLTENKGLPFMDAVKELAATAGMDVPAPDPRAAERNEMQAGLHDVMAAAARAPRPPGRARRRPCRGC